MSIKHFFSKQLLAAALVVSFSGLSIAQTAGTGTSAAGATPHAPLKTTPAMPATPAVPATPAMPATPAVPAKPALTSPAATKPTTVAPATSAAVSAGVAGNPDGSCPATSPVKVSRSKIYHVPEGRNYAKTKAKFCFESAQAAEQAGYRAPKK